MVLERRLTTASAPRVGWSALASPVVANRWGRALKRHPDAVRLGAELMRWYPPALRPLLAGADPTTDDRLRFCRACLQRGYHSPLFQLPWWEACPIHGEPLCEACPACANPVPAAFLPSDPSRALECRQCGHALADPARLAQLVARPPHDEIETWWAVIGDYRRWLRASRQVTWTMPLDVRGQGDFSDFARVAAYGLACLVPLPETLVPHVRATPDVPSARAWARSFVEDRDTLSVSDLGFDSPKAMQDAGERFYAAMPITQEAYQTLKRCHRQLRRRLGIHVIGRGSPRADPDAVSYDWRGRRPLAVQAFRLLSGLLQADRVDGVAYLDCRALDVLLEPPLQLAHEVLKRWTGVDLDAPRNWSQDAPMLLLIPSNILRSRLPRRVSPRPQRKTRLALRWLYERLIVEAWHDVALECFARAQPNGVIAWDVGSPPLGCGAPCKSFIYPVELKGEARDLPHPLLAHARTDRKRPRGWAAGVLRARSSDELEISLALLGRSAPRAFAPAYAPSFAARWRWPRGDEEPEEPQRARE